MAEIKKSAHGLPVIGIGTWEVPPADVERVITAAIDAGYRHIDCAWIYKNEKEVGLALKKAFDAGKVKREDLFITSKVWNTHKAPEDVRAAVAYTLKCLGVDYLDLYLVHWPVTWHPVPLDSALWGGEAPPGGESGSNFSYVPLSATWKEMEKLVEEGLVKQIGVSNLGVQLLADLLTYCKIRPICNQVELHPYHSQPSLLKACAYWGIEIVAYSPLGTTVKWQKGKPNVRDDPVILRIAEKRKISSADVILQWHLQRGVTVIPKSLSPDHIRSNLQTAFLPLLSEEEMSEINGLDKAGAGRYIHGDQPWSSFA